MEPMQVYGGENIPHVRFCYVEPGEEFNSSLGQLRIELEFACDRDEVLLKHLERYHPGPPAEVIQDQIACRGLLGWISGIVGVDEDIGVEK